jgi:hypothetical protein
VLAGSDEVEAAWLRGAAELVDRGERDRRATRAEALWLEELALEARAHKTWLLAGWVNAAEALRSAVHAHESERGPLVEALFPAWKGSSLRRHIDQALAAEVELQRRLASGYVVRRLTELTTRSAVGPALEALAAAGTVWAAERERPALAGESADEVRGRLLAAAGEATQLLDRVRWLVRAALARRSELLETVFPKRATRVTAPSAGGAPDKASAIPGESARGILATDLSPAPVASTATEREDESDLGSEAPAADRQERTRRRATRRSSTADAAAHVARGPAIAHPDPSAPEHPRRPASRRRSAKEPARRKGPGRSRPPRRS